MKKMRKKNQYSIRKVAELLGISTDAIRLYEKEGLVQAPRIESNRYRYYELEQIHRIMSVMQYRKLDVGISSIHELLKVSDLGSMSREYGKLIEQNEQEIQALQKKAERLRVMKNRLEEMEQGIGVFRLCDLERCYVVYDNSDEKIEYSKLKPVLSSPLFSYGNFSYIMKRDENDVYQAKKMQFVIRESMLPVAPISRESEEILGKREGGHCVYTVIETPELEQNEWDMNEMVRYAESHGYQVKDEAYAFYAYSLNTDHGVTDFYEIYLPLL